jgi:capsular polysaccharide biosynthesis protein
MLRPPRLKNASTRIWMTMPDDATPQPEHTPEARADHTLRRRLYRTRRQAIRSLDRLGRHLGATLRPETVLGRSASIEADQAAIEGLRQYRQVIPPREITLEAPRLRDFLARQNAVPSTNGTYTVPAVFYAELQHTRFDPRSGVLAAQDNTLLVDSVIDKRRLYRTPTYGSAVPTHFQRMAGTYSAVHGMWSNNYYHWMVECVFRLYTLQQYGEPVKLLIRRDLTPMQQETLAICKPDNVELVHLDDNETWIQAERFILPSYLNRGYKDFVHFPRPHLDYFRACMFRAFDVPADAPRDQRIYISRAGAKIRRLTNEADLVKVLGDYGFTAYRLEDLSLAEQVRLFSRACMIVAPHGAGLTNMIYADRARLLEITSRMITPLFFFMALSMDHTYYYSYPQEVPARLPSVYDSDRNRTARDGDITVDLDRLMPVLEAMVNAG